MAEEAADPRCAVDRWGGGTGVLSVVAARAAEHVVIRIERERSKSCAL